MAIMQPPFWTDAPDPFSVELDYTEIAIGGKLLQAKLDVGHYEKTQFKTDEEYRKAMKHRLAGEIARAMIESNFIEFTYLPQMNTDYDTIFARCYLAPDNQVKLLRQANAIPVQSK